MSDTKIWGAASRGGVSQRGRTSRPRAHRLSAIGLGPLLEGFHTARHTGTLAIQCGLMRRLLFLHRGQIFALPRQDDPHLAQTLELVLDMVFWEEARYSFHSGDLPEAFFHPQAAGRVRIALPADRLLMLVEHRSSAWEPIRQAIGGNSTVLRFVSRKVKARAISTCAVPSLLAAIDGRRTFEELIAISGAPRVKAGLILTRLLFSGRLRIAQAGSQRLPIQSARSA